MQYSSQEGLNGISTGCLSFPLGIQLDSHKTLCSRGFKMNKTKSLLLEKNFLRMISNIYQALLLYQALDYMTLLHDMLTATQCLGY